METSNAIKPIEQTQILPADGHVLPADGLKRLTDFFQLLIQIDQRERRKQNGTISGKTDAIAHGNVQTTTK